MATKPEVIEALAPFARRISQLDLTDPRAAMSALESEFPFATLDGIGALLRSARDEGWLTPRQATDRLFFGRVAKPSEETWGHSIDAVDMAGPGAPHIHPNGEVSLCFTLEGDPTFCDHPAGWVVVPPGSQHVPDVQGGRMLIVYFLPEGAMVWV